VDYRKLNEKIVKIRYPLPLIEDQLDFLQGAKVYSTLDLKNGFFHVPIEEASCKYTAFIVPNGHYEFLRMPFGLSTSPAYFQKYVNAVFRKLTAKRIVAIYMDDLIIPSVNVREGLSRLKLVFKTATRYGVSFNWKKCQLLKSKVDYLGYVIGNGRIAPSEEKTDAVRHFPKPTSIRTVQSFLGLTGYFRKFVPRYSLIARPLTELLKDGSKFTFGKKQEHAFDQLKLALSDGPILRLYCPTAETELHTDASALGCGAILLQRDSEDRLFHPIYYASGKTTSTEAKYDSYRLEVLAVVKALKKFRVYLIGISFTIITDCKAFMQTMKKRDICPQIARWALYLEEFQYSIVHRPGNNIRHVDALSRHPLPAAMLIEECRDDILPRLRQNQLGDEELRKIEKKVEQGQTDGFVIANGLLCKKLDGDTPIVVPRLMQTSIIRQIYERGHFGSAKTEQLLKPDYWFKDMHSKIEKVIQNCLACILAKKKLANRKDYSILSIKKPRWIRIMWTIWAQCRRHRKDINTYSR
jgi:ribonuclease HI